MRFPSRALVAVALVLGSTAVALSPAAARPTHRDDDDDRLRAAVTVRTDDYDFELILTPHVGEPGSPTAWVRRTDDVGRGFEDQPDAHGFVQMSGWSAQSGNKCLTSGGGRFSFDDSADHAFTYGVAGRSVRKVVVVMDDGTRVRTTTTRIVDDGFRGWMIERPEGEIDQVVGLDDRGRRVADLAPDFPDFTDFGQADTCVPYPFP
jgi:hypothetical protein